MLFDVQGSGPPYRTGLVTCEAIKNAGFKPVRADEINKSNLIVPDIIKRIIDSKMIVCDLSH